MNLKKSVVIISFGTLLEWAEFTFFAYMVDYLSRLFFSANDVTLARLKIYGVFAASYIMRPIGAIIFGHIGDKYGRKTPMIASLLLMAFATCGIGILPTYDSIGGVSSFLLIILRMIQGIAVGGEFNGATVLLTEYDKRRPFLAGSWTAFASSAGMALGSLAAAIVSFFNGSFLWRIPFLLSAIIALFAVYLRRDMKETDDFRLAKENNELFDVPISAAWRHNKAGLACTAAFSIFVSVFVYTGNIYYKTMAVSVGGLPVEQAATAVMIGVMLNTVLIPIFAYMADRFNGYKLCFIGLFLALILSPLIMSLAISGNFAYTVLGQLIYSIPDATVSATAFTILLRQFKTGAKYSGSGLAWSISTAIFGGTTLMVNELLVGRLNLPVGPGLYMSLSALICLITVGYVCGNQLKSDIARND
ncbi:MAG: MFS transporter [Holosporaceae bacterium]|jgi:MHS family proline/betaine transporter-like MFS transporter|nr:MFS transporter [Holosporaceae bacterium]